MNVNEINALIEIIQQRVSEDEKDMAEPSLQSEYFISKVEENPNMKKIYLDAFYELLPESDAVIEVLKELQGELPIIDHRIPALIARLNASKEHYNKLIEVIKQT